MSERNETVLMVDPPSGWMYGFPKACPKDIWGSERFRAWLVENGYPEKHADFACSYMRVWEKEVSNEPA